MAKFKFNPSPVIIVALGYTLFFAAFLGIIGLCGGFNTPKDRWTKTEIQQIIQEELKK